MADENNPDDTAVVVETTTPAEVVSLKKRGPRAKKVGSKATSTETGIAPTVKSSRKRKEEATEVKPASPTAASAKTVEKTTAKSPVAKPAAEVPPAALDEIADLLQLEEENARLRKALSEKLRAENADLRKRLGLA
ncbi:hypothetical protein D9M70_527030 [compost metagenome]